MIYTVKDIEEPDFGCEGLMDGQQVIDKVTLIDEKGNLLYIEAADMYPSLLFTLLYIIFIMNIQP